MSDGDRATYIVVLDGKIATRRVWSVYSKALDFARKVGGAVIAGWFHELRFDEGCPPRMNGAPKPSLPSPRMSVVPTSGTVMTGNDPKKQPMTPVQAEISGSWGASCVVSAVDPKLARSLADTVEDPRRKK